MNETAGSSGRLPGRPRRSAVASPEAGQKLTAAMTRAGVTNAAMAEATDATPRAITAWRSGSFGPRRDQVKAIEAILDDPTAGSWWAWDEPDQVTALEARLEPEPVIGAESEPELVADPRPVINPDPVAGPDPVAVPVPEPETKSVWASRWPSRRVTLVLVAALVLLVVGAGLTWVFTRQGDSSSPSPQSTSASRTVSSPAPSRLPAAFTGTVDGTMAPTPKRAHTIGLWTLPSTSGGCDISPCEPGTQQSGGSVVPGQRIAVSCVAYGQRVRNGEPASPGYYDDDRWVQVASGQNLGQQADQVAYLANIWFVHDKLPASLPVCPGYPK